MTRPRAQGSRSNREQQAVASRKHASNICPKVYDGICPPVVGMVGSRAGQRPVVIQSAVRSSLGLEVPKPSSHIMKKSNPNHQDLQPDTSRRCKGSGEKGTDQGWDRGGVRGSPGGGVVTHGQVFTFPTSTWGQAQQKGQHEQLF